MPRNKSLERTLNVLLVLRRGRRTLIELAFMFGVCERTIRRDIEALEAAQVPICHGSETGEEWGCYWWIDRNYTL